MPRGGFVALGPDELRNLELPRAASTAREAFDFRWVSDLLGQVLCELRKEYVSTERAAYWELFRLKILAPIFDDVESPPLAQICAQLKIESESKASNMIVTVKRRFRAVLKRHLRDLVESDAEAEDELNDIFEILSEARAR